MIAAGQLGPICRKPPSTTRQNSLLPKLAMRDDSALAALTNASFLFHVNSVEILMKHPIVAGLIWPLQRRVFCLDFLLSGGEFLRVGGGGGERTHGACKGPMTSVDSIRLDIALHLVGPRRLSGVANSADLVVRCIGKKSYAALQLPF